MDIEELNKTEVDLHKTLNKITERKTTLIKEINIENSENKLCCICLDQEKTIMLWPC